MKSLCVIPARGGSKRIPRKNVREFAGKPIIAWSIEAAHQAGCFDHIIVSTDDEEIAQVAKTWGADVPFIRPAELSDDMTGTIPVIAHATDEMDRRDGPYEKVCCMYATAPFVRVQDLLQGKDRIDEGWSFAFPVTEFPAPIFRSFRLLPEGGVQMFYPERFTTRSQDIENAYHDAGQFYWGTAQAWKTNTVLFGADSAAIKIPRRFVQDIDTEEDWIVAEHMFNAIKSERSE
jgi:pseudaminic acid cytidylyltransferase